MYLNNNLILDSNINKISDIEYMIVVDNYIDNNILIIKDGLLIYSETINIINENINKDFLMDYLEVKAYYMRDKLFLNISNKNGIVEDTILNIEGDLNKNIIWRKCVGDKNIEITFPFHITGFSTLKILINKKVFNLDVYNLEDFPKNFMKVKDGFKMNKSCIFDLKIKTLTNEIILKSGEIYFNIINDSIISVYIKDYLLFEQDMTNISHLPIVSILSYPKPKVVLSHIFSETIKFKIKNKWYIIEAGKISVDIKLNKGIHNIVIYDTINCIFDKKSCVITCYSCLKDGYI